MKGDHYCAGLESSSLDVRAEITFLSNLFKLARPQRPFIQTPLTRSTPLRPYDEILIDTRSSYEDILRGNHHLAIPHSLVGNNFLQTLWDIETGILAAGFIFLINSIPCEES